MRQHICLWSKHNSLRVDSEYSTSDETIPLWLILSHLDDVYLLQRVCSNACIIWLIYRGLAVNGGQFLAAVNLHTACSERSGRWSEAASSSKIEGSQTHLPSDALVCTAQQAAHENFFDCKSFPLPLQRSDLHSHNFSCSQRSTAEWRICPTSLLYAV